MDDIRFTQLDAISTEDLVSILINRFDHVVFYGVKVDAEDENLIAWQGDEAQCMGLCNKLVLKINEESTEYLEEADDDEQGV